MSHPNQIRYAEIQAEIRRLEDERAKITDEAKALANGLKKELNNARLPIGPIDVYASSGWTMHVGLRGEFQLTADRRWVVRDEEGTYDDYVYVTEQAKGYRQLPTPEMADKLVEMCEAYAAKHNIPVGIYYKEVKTDVPDTIESLRDIRLHHPGQSVALVGKGEVAYKGWDIKDKYIVVTIDGVEWAFWDSSGHGRGLTNRAQKGTDAWKGFELFVGQED